MKKMGLFLSILIGSLFLGCVHNNSNVSKDINTTITTTNKINKNIAFCEMNYKKCNLDCDISNINGEKWEKIVCKLNCKSLYNSCKIKNDNK